MMKILMIGLGSIGKKHLINLNHVLLERKQSFIFDALRSGSGNLVKEISNLIDQQYYNYEELPIDYDIVFITNPTASHYTTIQQVSHNTKAMFIEKPLFEQDTYQIENLQLDKNGIYYIACPLRHKAIIQYIKKIVAQGEPIYAARAISTSYLPEWRKKIDYRTVYSAKKSLGGGVTLDLIHEWDYLVYLFGMPLRTHHINGKYSDLEIDADDVSVYIAEYQDKVVEVHLDYIGRKPERKLELFCKDYKIEADLLNETITYTGELERKVCFEEENFYRAEIECFLDIVEGKRENMNSIEHAKQILELVLREG